ncbi:YCF48-related protein [Sphingobacterium mizutaii]|uniref:YCF48-related protein n=1 Tax=Sphingobacterium mizutaii TaxID=1010 RepID=UPI003D9A042B
MKRYFLLSVACLFALQSYSQSFQTLTSGNKASFRGLETYKNKVVWVSGSNGTVGKSMDSGKTWEWVSPKGYEKFDFRDIEVFSAKEAVIVSAGAPAVILYTKDGGKTWIETYKNEDPAIFLDGMDFSGKTGYVLGDPIEGQFQLLKSNNKGKNWTDVTEEIHLFAEPGEAAFAASGSSLQVINDWLYIGTGGTYSSLMKRSEKERKLDVQDVPIWSGAASTGIFSIDFLNERVGVVVGGNYTSDKDNSNNILLTHNGGLSWGKPEIPVHGYRSSVKYISPETLIATGTSGTDISYDSGKTWKNISTESFNVIAVSSNKKLIYLAGSNGNVVQLSL